MEPALAFCVLIQYMAATVLKSENLEQKEAYQEILFDYQVPFDECNDDLLNYIANYSFNENNAISK